MTAMLSTLTAKEPSEEMEISAGTNELCIGADAVPSPCRPTSRKRTHRPSGHDQLADLTIDIIGYQNKGTIRRG